MRADGVGVRDRGFQAMQPDSDVLPVGLQDICGHFTRTRRTVDLEALQPPRYRRSKNQIRKTNGVIRMEMGDEHAGELPHLNTRFGGAPDDAGAAIDDIDAITRDDCNGWAHALRIRIWIAGA